MEDESVFVLTECGKMFLEPYMEKLPSLFVSYFKSILKVGYDIPRLEYYMSRGEWSNPISLLLRFLSFEFAFFFVLA